MRSRAVLRITTILFTIIVIATACGGDDPPSSSDDTAPGEVETGPGVTDEAITLGILTDLTGVFAGGGKAQVAGAELYWNEINDQGGICDRQIELQIEDHGYDPQRASAAYQDLQPDVLALHQVLGSPVQAAILPLAEQDEVVLGVIGWSSAFLSNQYAVITGATYDVQFIAGLQYLLDEGLIKEGDAIGHIYFTGDFGENGLLGSKFAAEQLGLEVLEAEIDPTVTDLTAQVTSFQNRGATAILLGAAPPQLIAVANAQIALDYDVPILGQIPPFQPSLLEDPDVGDHLGELYYEATPIAPFAHDTPEGQQVAELFEGATTDVPPQIDVNYAYAHAVMFGEALKVACDQGDLTRAGFRDALHSLENIETGVSTPLSYKVGGPSGTEVYIARPSDAPGGLEVVAESVTSPLVNEYQFP